MTFWLMTDDDDHVMTLGQGDPDFIDGMQGEFLEHDQYLGHVNVRHYPEQTSKRERDDKRDDGLGNISLPDVVQTSDEEVRVPDETRPTKSRRPKKKSLKWDDDHLVVYPRRQLKGATGCIRGVTGPLIFAEFFDHETSSDRIVSFHEDDVAHVEEPLKFKAEDILFRRIRFDALELHEDEIASAMETLSCGDDVATFAGVNVFIYQEEVEFE